MFNYFSKGLLVLNFLLFSGILNAQIVPYHFPQNAARFNIKSPNNNIQTVKLEDGHIVTCARMKDGSTRITDIDLNDEVVNLKIYDILGREVVSLYNGVARGGKLPLTFDGSDLSSGMYFVKATVPGKMDQTIKMVLMK